MESLLYGFEMLDILIFSFKINSLLEILGPRLTSLHLMLDKRSELDTSMDMDHDGEDQAEVFIE